MNTFKSFEQLEEYLGKLKKANKDIVFKVEDSRIVPMTEKEYYSDFIYRLEVCSSKGVRCKYYVEELDLDNPRDEEIASKSYVLRDNDDDRFFDSMDELNEITPSSVVYCISESDSYYHKGEHNISDFLFLNEEEADEYMWENFIMPALENDDQVPYPFTYPDDVVTCLKDNNVDIEDVVVETTENIKI
ncbi:MAG: hypothetical protein D6732_00195 [Methanobacteriota archaeon]|nr:MAG: hypothetical protein D6732_00195 [Euryarchaeota archaeon]